MPTFNRPRLFLAAAALLLAVSCASEQETLQVESVGEGPIGLTTSTPVEAEPEQVSGTLIVGPGSCYALVDDAQPQLLIFGDDAEFASAQDQPSVTTDATGTVRAEEQIELSAVQIDQDEVSGVPEHCAEGADETLLAVRN